jgi:peptide/nickel transport system permease protein
MTSVIIQRLTSAIFVMLGVVVLVGALIHIVPGDPVDTMLGESATPVDRETLRQNLGLDRPIPVQIGSYLVNVLRGDFGESIYFKRPIIDILAERIPSTALLAISAMVVTLCIALPLGILAALRQGRWQDTVAMSFSLLGVSVPSFVTGLLLILIFAFGLGWFPVSGREGIGSLVLPAVTLGVGMAALLSRMVRSCLLEVLHEDYIRTARAKGLGEGAVVVKHALQNAALPIITLLGLQLGTLLGGAVISETVFSWPGVGSLMVEAIQRRDYPLVQTCVLLISATYVVVNSVTDMLYYFADPRIRSAVR